MFAVTLMILSAVVGAGFATGAELIAFFGTSALPPIAIAALVGVFLFCVMAALLFLRENINKKIFAPIFFIFFAAMAAGVTELVGPAVSAVAVVTSVLVVWFGFEHMLTANKVLMEFALAVLLIVVLLNLGTAIPKTNLSSNVWTTAGFALLYAGMNCCVLPAIFAEARKAFSRRELLVCIFAAAVVVSFFVLVILAAISANKTAAGAPMPILALSDNFFVKFAVLVCILTSMFATLFSLRQRDNAKQNISQNTNQNTNKNSNQNIFRLSCIAALGYACSFLGFKSVIGIFYPIVGAVMIGFIVFCFSRECFSRVRRRFRQCRSARVPAFPVRED